MKKLYLMRHGHSPFASQSGADADAKRVLSEQGRSDVHRMAEELSRRGIAPSVILHSPLTRAVQTAMEAAGVLEAPCEIFEFLDNTRLATDVVDALAERGAAESEVLAVGHQPQIGEIASLLTEEFFEMRPGSIVAIEWGPPARLLWSLSPEEV